MGVIHGKKKDSPETHVNRSASVKQTHLNEQQVQDPVSHLQSEPGSSNLIRPQKSLKPLTASTSHQELHRELRMVSKRRVFHEGKPELQRALEKRRWQQRMKTSTDQEEASPLHQELLKRHQRLEELEGDKGQQQEGPEFLRVKERLRRTTKQDERK